MRWIACIVTAFFTSVAHGAITPDPTGLWFDPAESGWGLSLAQQGDTIFAVLFVYDSAGKPAWFVADNMRKAPITVPLVPNPPMGTLYRTSGPWFGGTFDPHAVSAVPVGNIGVSYDQGLPTDGSELLVGYSIDGVQVLKLVHRQSWGDNRQNLAGRFSGGMVIFTSPTGACPALNVSPPSGVPFGISIASGPLANELRITWGTGIDTLCSIDGTYTQQGQLGSVAGTLGCAPVGFTLPRDVTAQVTALVGNANGFSGAVTLQQGSCTYVGHVGGVGLP